jgi:hypothetical protein
VNIANTLTLGGSSANLSTNNGLALTSGVAAGMADKTYWAYRTLTASSSETLDLAGVLLDPFGVAITFARVKVLLIAADAANTNNVVVGGGATTLTGIFGATTHTAVIRPGAALAWVTGAADATGYAVTAGTGDLLQVANSGAGTPVSYSVIVIGTST